MDPLTTLALVGTARQGEPAEAAGSPVDTILSGLTEVGVERRVLLAAGARAAAAMAGRRSSRSAAMIPVSPPETRPQCSAKAARILGDLLHGHHPELLPEAFALLSKAGQRIPHPLLPDAFRVRGDELRAAVRPVLGERGAWLARLNDTWSWALSMSASASLEELEAAWTDGTAAARRELIVRARGIDPARARAWLEATWPNEKADERAALLAGLRTGIGPDDEAFLETQLRDRASSVREAAQALLPHLPGSAFVARMKSRADGTLDFKRSMLSFVGKRGSFSVSPPETMDDAGERDGLGKPPPGTGARAYWLTRTLAAVPLSHWTTRFGTTPAELVAAAQGTDWAGAVCSGWTHAALVSGEAEWLAALWEFFQHADDKSVAVNVAGTMQLSILRRMTPADAASRVEQSLDTPSPRLNLSLALSALPSPWPPSLGMRWLEELRRGLFGAQSAATVLPTMRLASLALPRECFARALEPIDLPEGAPPYWETQLTELTDIVRLRHDLAKEIAP
jgi:hypothetical protein